MFAIDRAGLVGADGETHHGIYDISFMRVLPNIIIMTPSNENEMWMMLNTGLQFEGPSAIRYPRGNSSGNEVIITNESIEVGKSLTVCEGGPIAILVFGELLNKVFDISKKLSLTLIDMRFAKPLDANKINELSKTHKYFITIEDNVVMGGAGSAVNEYITENGLDINIINLGIPDRIISHGSQDELYEEIGLDKKSLEIKINELYNHITKKEKVIK
jgi:1-deoxy-D-xylulose-5-phosphate synthase